MSSELHPTIYAINFGTSNSLLAAASAEATCAPIPLDDEASDPTVLRSVLFFDGAQRYSCGSREDIARREFEATGERAISAIVRALDQTVAAAGVSFEDIDVVCCTGGTARVPRIGEALQQRFGEGKVQRLRSFHSVVQGLAERARQLAAGAGVGVGVH